MKKALILFTMLALTSFASAQTVTSYYDFTGMTSLPAKWVAPANMGTGLNSMTITGGALAPTGLDSTWSLIILDSGITARNKIGITWHFPTLGVSTANDQLLFRVGIFTKYKSASYTADDTMGVMGFALLNWTTIFYTQGSKGMAFSPSLMYAYNQNIGGGNLTLTAGYSDTMKILIDSVSTDLRSQMTFKRNSSTGDVLPDTAWSPGADSRMNGNSSTNSPWYLGFMVYKLPGGSFTINKVKVTYYGSVILPRDTVPPSVGNVSVTYGCSGSAHLVIPTTDAYGVKKIESIVSGAGGVGYLTGSKATSRDTINGTGGQLSLSLTTREYTTDAATYYDTIRVTDDTSNVTDYVYSFTSAGVTDLPGVVTSDTISATGAIDSTVSFHQTARLTVACGTVTKVTFWFKPVGGNWTSRWVTLPTSNDVTVSTGDTTFRGVGTTYYYGVTMETSAGLKTSDTALHKSFTIYQSSSVGTWRTLYFTRGGSIQPENVNLDGITHVIFQLDGFGATGQGWVSSTPPYVKILQSQADSIAMEWCPGDGTDQVRRLINVCHNHVPYIKVLLGLGGIYGAAGTGLGAQFAVACADSASTQLFVTTTWNWAQPKGFDGVDIDWEQYATTTAMSRLCRILRNTMGPNATISIATDHLNPGLYDKTQLVDVANVNQFNMMMYNMDDVGSGWGDTRAWLVGHNSPYGRPDSSRFPMLHNVQISWSDSSYDYNQTSFTGVPHRLCGPLYWKKLGWPMDRIGVGIKTYMDVWPDASDPGVPTTRGWGAMREINRKALYDIQAILPQSAQKYDALARAAYTSGTMPSAYSTWGLQLAAGQNVYCTYEDSIAIAIKMDFVKREGLGGVMLWEISGGLKEGNVGYYTGQTHNDVPVVRWVVQSLGSVYRPVDVPSAPTTITPTNGATDVFLAPQFVWNTATGATSYSVQISTNSSFTSGIIIQNVSSADTTCTLLSNPPGTQNYQLAYSTLYYYRVRGENSGGIGQWSSTKSFTTLARVNVSNPPSAPTLNYPAGDTANFTTPFTFTWTTVDSASSYNFQLVYNDSGSATYSINQTLLSVNYYPCLATLSPNSKYYWRAAAVNASGTTWTPWRGLTTASGIIAVVDTTSDYEIWIKNKSSGLFQRQGPANWFDLDNVADLNSVPTPQVGKARLAKSGTKLYIILNNNGYRVVLQVSQ